MLFPLSLLSGICPGSWQMTGRHLTRDQQAWSLMPSVPDYNDRYVRAAKPQEGKRQLPASSFSGPVASVHCHFLITVSCRFTQPCDGAKQLGVWAVGFRNQQWYPTTHCHLCMTQLALRTHWLNPSPCNQTCYILEWELPLQMYLQSDWVTSRQKWPPQGSLGQG